MTSDVFFICKIWYLVCQAQFMVMNLKFIIILLITQTIKTYLSLTWHDLHIRLHTEGTYYD